MATRLVWGLVDQSGQVVDDSDPDKQPERIPWPDFQINFTLTPSVTMSHATLPYQTTSVTTDADGYFSIALQQNAKYVGELYTAFIRHGSSVSTPAGTGMRFEFTVPEGDTPISLSTIRASEIPDPLDPTLPNIVADLQAGLPGQITEAIAADGTVVDAAAQATKDAADQIDYGGYVEPLVPPLVETAVANDPTVAAHDESITDILDYIGYRKYGGGIYGGGTYGVGGLIITEEN